MEILYQEIFWKAHISPYKLQILYHVYIILILNVKLLHLSCNPKPCLLLDILLAIIVN